MIEREVALQILGLEDGVDRAEIDAAYRALRAHVEERLGEADSDASREARRAELRDLEGVHRAAIAPGQATGPAAHAPLYREVVSEERTVRRRAIPRWLLGWAVVATIAAACLVVFLFFVPGEFGPAVLVGGSGSGIGGGGGGFALDGEGGIGAPAGEGDEAGPVGEVQPAGARAEVVVKSEVTGARLRIIRSGTGDAPEEVVAEGETDETVYYLAPGSYALEVQHADCPDTWRRDVAVAGGETHRFDSLVCRSTGWLSVRSDQPNDRVSIDGERVGSSAEARHTVPAGEHEVRVEKEGYEPWEGVVAVVPGKVTGIRPRLGALRSQERRKPKPKEEPSAQPAGATQGEDEPNGLRELGGWHEEAKQWLLSNYDEDLSGELDSQEEIDAVPCDQWLGLEKSYDSSGLGLSLTRFYGFDGDGWKDDALGVDSGYRDIAHERMKECGLR